MKKPVLSVYLLVTGLALAGCSSTSNLLSGSRGPDAANVPTGRNLAMPPDLQLPAPGSGPVASYQPSQPEANYSAAASAPAGDDGVYGTPAATPRSTLGRTKCPNGTMAMDMYACYNINKLTADGKKKTQAQLSEELRTAMLEEKRRTNPSYGTVKNFGELFN